MYTVTSLAHEAQVCLGSAQVCVICTQMQYSRLNSVRALLCQVHVYLWCHLCCSNICRQPLWSLHMTLMALTSPVDAIPCSALQRK